MEADGAKLRDAEVRAGERPKPVKLPSASAADGVRRRGEQQRQPGRPRPATRISSEGWSGQKGMPGALAPGAFR
jgi:maintenance of morphology protein 1